MTFPFTTENAGVSPRRYCLERKVMYPYSGGSKLLHRKSGSMATMSR